MERGVIKHKDNLRDLGFSVEKMSEVSLSPVQALCSQLKGILNHGSLCHFHPNRKTITGNRMPNYILKTMNSTAIFFRPLRHVCSPSIGEGGQNITALIGEEVNFTKRATVSALVVLMLTQFE